MTAKSEHPGAGLAILAVLGSLAGWTSIPLFLRHFTSVMDAWTANGWRYAISALIWAPVLILAWARGTTPKGLWRAALVPSLFNIGAQVCFALAPYYVEPGLMIFSMRLQIVFIMFGAAVMFPAERRVIRSGLFLLGLGLLIAGTLLTILLRPGGLGGGTAVGIAISIASGLLYASYALAVRKYMQAINPITAFAAVSQCTAAALVAVMLVLAQDKATGAHDFGASVLRLSPDQQVYLFLSSIIGIGLGHTFYFYSISKLGVAVSAGVVQLQPITVSIGSMLLFNEAIVPAQWATGLTAVAGAAVMLLAQVRIARRARITPAANDLGSAEEAQADCLCAACDHDRSRLTAGTPCPECGAPSRAR